MELPVSVYRTAFLDFVLVAVSERTKVWEVRSLSQAGTVLGTIRWYARWRQYVFYPAPETLFNVLCLFDIARFLRAEMAARRKARGKVRQTTLAGVEA